MSEARKWDPSTVSIRLFDPDDEPISSRSGGLSPRMTLSQFAASFVIGVWLVSRDVDEKTIVEYQTSVAYWVKHTGDPPLDRINDLSGIDMDDHEAVFARSHTARFLRGIRLEKGRKPGENMHAYTIRKHCRNLQTIFDLAGPRGTRSPAARQAQNLIDGDRIPWLEKPDAEDKKVEIFKLAEIDRILLAAPLMRRPLIRGISPAQFWSNFVAGVYNIGERRGAILHVTFADLDDSKPDEFPYGVLNFPRGIRKRKRRSHEVPLNAGARGAIERMVPRGLTLDDAREQRLRIWPWPHDQRHFSRRWKRLLALAEIPEARRFGPHALRKTLITAAAKISPLAAQLLGGHSDWQTTQRHYVHQGVVAETLAQVPQPEMLKEMPEPKRQDKGAGIDALQRRLFD